MFKVVRSNWKFLLIGGILITIMFSQRTLDTRYWRPIGGDGKAYYAYLPAIFIYQDFSYSFIDEMEMKYYPEDGSLRKHFEMKQPNGTVVNKTFPGVALFYLPFFGLAALFSWIFGFPLDGYSLLFQWSIPIAHIFYLLLGLFFLDKAMKNLSLGKWARNTAVVSGVFASNVYFYVVYDNTVSHIFGFSGACVLLWLITSFRQSKNFKFLAWTIPLMSFLVITRPTNLMMSSFYLIILDKNQLTSLFHFRRWIQPKNGFTILLGGLILFIPFLLWKLQSDNWLVYSYGEEGFDFLHPHWWQFLVSFKQGWWLWTPIMLPIFIVSTIYFWKQKPLQGVLFFFSILIITYVFSSWWSWTFGMAFGQRPMIDFYPILLLGFAGFIQEFKLKGWLILIIPFIFLNVLQSFQGLRGIILLSGTTKETYWNNLFKTRKDPPKVTIKSSWKLVEKCEKSLDKRTINADNPFSDACQIQTHQSGDFYVVSASVSGENGTSNVQLVFSGDKGSEYQTNYLKDQIYSNKRTFSFEYHPNDSIITPISCYIWNNENNPVQVFDLKLTKYTK